MPGGRPPKKPDTTINHPTRIAARNFWFTEGKPSMRALSELLRAKGFTADDKTLGKWMREDPIWLAGMAEKQIPSDPVILIDAIRNAKAMAEHLSPEVYMGVKAQLISRLYSTMATLPINTVTEWNDALSACDRLEALIHAERGREISDGGTLRTGTGGESTGSILAAMAPEVTVTPFRRPSPPASTSNGHGPNGSKA